MDSAMPEYDDTRYYHITELITKRTIKPETIFDLSRIANSNINIDISVYYPVSEEDLSKLRFKKSDEHLIKHGMYNYIKADGVYYKRYRRFIEFDFHNKENVIEDKDGNYHVLYRKYISGEIIISNIINLSNIHEFLFSEYKNFLIDEYEDVSFARDFFTFIHCPIHELELRSYQLKLLCNIAHSKDIEYLNSLISVTLKS